MNFMPPSTRIYSNKQIWLEVQLMSNIVFEVNIHFSEFKLQNEGSFIPELNVYCGPLLKLCLALLREGKWYGILAL
jgi:hypothetical protein